MRAEVSQKSHDLLAYTDGSLFHLTQATCFISVVDTEAADVQPSCHQFPEMKSALLTQQHRHSYLQ